LLPVPGQALGLVVLVAVLTAALISAPLMVASAEQAAWEQQRARLSEGILGTTLVSATAMGGPAAFARLGRAAELDAAVSEAAAAADLSAPVPFASLRDDLVAYGPSGVGLAQLIHRTDASSHVEIVAGAPSDDGVLVPAALAESAGLRPGDLVALASEDGAETQVPVSGVYTTPTAPLDPYWEGKGYLFLPFPDPTTGDLVTPPPVLLGSPDVVYAAASAVRVNLNLEWQFPLPEATGVADARATAADMERLQVAISDPESAVSRVVGEYDFAYPAPITALPEVLTTVDKTVELLSPPVRAVGIGGAAAALVLVGAWAGLRIRGRDDEVRSLVARGLSPLRGAGQAVREALLPVLIGSAVGAAAGWLLVRELGPAAELPPSALPRSLTLLAAGALAVLAVVAVVTGVLVARVDSVGRGPAAQLLGRIPWLAVTAAVAVVAAVPLVTAEPDAAGTGFGVLTLVAPLLVTVVVAGAVTAVLPRIGRRADARLRRLPPGAFLAVRRVLAGQGAARLVVVTTALSLGLVVYAGALTDSTARTVEAKAAVATGSDVVVPLVRSRAADGPLPGDAMVVATDSDAGLLPGDLDVDVVAVTPEDVAGVVRWNERLAEQPLGDLMAALAGYEGDRVPVVLAGPVPDAVLEATGGELTLDFRYYTLPVQVVGRADAFPGQGSRDPLLVADWDRYLAGLETANRDPGLVLTLEVWARGTAPAVVQSLVEAGFTPDHLEDVTTSAAFADRPELRAQTWSLAYLRAVALAAGVLGLVGVAMHAVSQQRRRTSAGLLLSRMGMSRRSADAAAGLEIGLLTGLSALVAVLVALPASTWVLRLLDPVPSLQPDALFAVPWSSIGAVVLGVVLVTVGGAVLVGRAARRATGGQVMRDAS
jgi:hypothetical protein